MVSWVRWRSDGAYDAETERRGQQLELGVLSGLPRPSRMSDARRSTSSAPGFEVEIGERQCRFSAEFGIARSCAECTDNSVDPKAPAGPILSLVQRRLEVQH
jgi:hypothetical protein